MDMSTSNGQGADNRDWWACACSAARPMTETTCAKCGESIDAAKITLLREQAEVAEQMEQDELAHLREQSVPQITSRMVAAIERARPLCPDCRDKCAGEDCLRCQIQALTRREEHLRARLAEVEAERNAYKGRIADADVSIGNLQAAWKKMKAERNAALARADKLAAGVEKLGIAGKKAWIVGSSEPDYYEVVAKFRCIEDMQAFHRALVELGKVYQELDSALANQEMPNDQA